MTKTLIVPGLDGSPAPHWQDWWARTDPTAMMVDMPSPHRPVREAWEAALAVTVLKHPGSILVGHSLGAVVIAQLLANWPDLRVRGAMFVAPADASRCERQRGFETLPDITFDVPTVLVASRNDPWMSYDQSAELADQWGSSLIDMGHAGHINAASGFGPWAGGKLIRDDLMEQTARPSAFRRLYNSATGLAGEFRAQLR